LHTRVSSSKTSGVMVTSSFIVFYLALLMVVFALRRISTDTFERNFNALVKLPGHI
jgi:hypothetical protein